MISALGGNTRAWSAYSSDNPDRSPLSDVASHDFTAASMSLLLMVANCEPSIGRAEASTRCSGASTRSPGRSSLQKWRRPLHRRERSRCCSPTSRDRPVGGTTTARPCVGPSSVTTSWSDRRSPSETGSCSRPRATASRLPSRTPALRSTRPTASRPRLAREDFDEVGGLRVRIGLHSGLATVRDGDYFGPNVAVAAQLTAAGHGGQVLLSGSTAALVSDDTRSLGEHRLATCPNRSPCTSCSATTSTMASTRSAPPRWRGCSLPAQRSSFVDAPTNYREVIKLLDDSSLVTLTGSGGTGKNAIGDRDGGGAGAHVEGAVVFVDLSTATDLDEINTSLASALGVTLDPADSVRHQLVERIGGRVALLVVDNCEHLLDDVADLVGRPGPPAVGEGAAHLARAARRRGRAGLPRATARHRRRLPAAVRLFVDRALTAEPDLDVDAEARGGDRRDLPAPRPASRWPSSWLRRGRGCSRWSRSTIGCPTGSPSSPAAGAGAASRQQTLESTIGWSYDLLEADEQGGLPRSLGVFASSLGPRRRGGGRSGTSGGYGDRPCSTRLVGQAHWSVHLAGDRPAIPVARDHAGLRRNQAHRRRRERGGPRPPPPALRRFGARREIVLWSATPTVYDQLTAEFDNLLQALDWAMVQGRGADATTLIDTATLAVNRGYVELISTRIDAALELELGLVAEATVASRLRLGGHPGPRPRSWSDIVAAGSCSTGVGDDAPVDLVVPTLAWQCFIAADQPGSRPARAASEDSTFEGRPIAEVDARVARLTPFHAGPVPALSVTLVRCYDLRCGRRARADRAGGRHLWRCRPSDPCGQHPHRVRGCTPCWRSTRSTRPSPQQCVTRPSSDRPGLWEPCSRRCAHGARAPGGRRSRSTRPAHRLLDAAERESSLRPISGVRADAGCWGLRVATAGWGVGRRGTSAVDRLVSDRAGDSLTGPRVLRHPPRQPARTRAAPREIRVAGRPRRPPTSGCAALRRDPSSARSPPNPRSRCARWHIRRSLT